MNPKHKALENAKKAYPLSHGKLLKVSKNVKDLRNSLTDYAKNHGMRSEKQHVSLAYRSAEKSHRESENKRREAREYFKNQRS